VNSLEARPALLSWLVAMLREIPFNLFGGPGRTRTCDLRFRKPSLYPAELRSRELGNKVGVRDYQRLPDLGDRPSVMQRWKASPNLLDPFQVDIREMDSDFIARIEQHLTPWIDDQRVAVSLPSVFVTT
jgi:hypothetical protein